MVKEHLTIRCLRCGEPMHFIAAQPAAGALAELWRFECAGCDEIRVIAKAEAVRPVELRGRSWAEEFCLT